MTKPQGVTCVSDTALWVAVYRAMETERPDALFEDPYAGRLAGERGREIVRAMPKGRQSAWPMIVRTRVFDELIAERVPQVSCVVNLAAGLDTRPYRLALPESLTWIEADLPGMIEHKESRLAGEKPRCALERKAVDLTDAAARRAFLDEVCARFSRVLVISEGLLIYLAPEQVAALSDALLERPQFRWWLLDYATPPLRAILEKRWGGPLRQGNAEWKFFPEEGAGFFTQRGWRPAELRYTGEEAKRLDRQMPLAWLWNAAARLMPAAKREAYRTMSAYALLQNSKEAA